VTQLRHVDATRAPGAFARFYAALAARRVSRIVSRWVSWKLDPILLRATGGRVATTLVFPTAVLEKVGAKSGARRRKSYRRDAAKVRRTIPIVQLHPEPSRLGLECRVP
jgi:hypothetical protein